MKKWKFISVALLLSIVLAACGGNNDTNNNDDANNTATDGANEMTDDNTDMNGDNGDNGDTNLTENDNDGDQSRMEVAEAAADRVADLEGVANATVIVTDNNAYAAVVLDNQQEGDEEIGADLESQIADEVRQVDETIENVYVSSNPDFVQRMSGYVTKVNEGQPISGFFEEFTEAVQNVFPDAR